jgi:hypothetical protein
MCGLMCGFLSLLDAALSMVDPPAPRRLAQREPERPVAPNTEAVEDAVEAAWVQDMNAVSFIRQAEVR